MGKIIYKNKEYYIVRDLLFQLQQEKVIEVIGCLIPYVREGDNLTFGEFREIMKKEGLIGKKISEVGK